MKRMIWGLWALLLLLSCGENRQKTISHRLTLLTYNVGVFSKYEESGIKGVAQLIRESGATLVALNELDSCNRRHKTYQLKDLAQELGGWSFAFASAFPYADGAYGNGVVSKEPIAASYKVQLPKEDGSEPRSVAVVETADCVFAAVHLDHKSSGAALRQMQTVNEWFTAHFTGYDKPVFLCGDFNVTPDSAVIAEADNCWTLLSGTEFTHSTTNLKHCIDYIFAFKAAAPVRVEGAQVYKKDADRLSDHYPVRVTVTY